MLLIKMKGFPNAAAPQEFVMTRLRINVMFSQNTTRCYLPLVAGAAQMAPQQAQLQAGLSLSA